MIGTHVTTFAEDLFGLKPFCEQLERFLIVEQNFVDGSLVVSLTAPFGFGKTTFLTMWKSDLEERRESDPNCLRPILLNAWESDYCGDPLIAIVSGLINAVEKNGNEEQVNSKKLREAAKDIGWFAVGSASSLISHWTGFNPVEAGKLAESKKKKRSPDCVALFQDRTNSLQNLKKSLKSVFSKEGEKAVVFVDELDRCRPDYAVKYLETIKHVFDIPGLTFVLAVDHEHLANSARTLFGQQLKYDEYLRKFVHRNVAMPKLENEGLISLSRKYAEIFFEKHGKRFCLLNPEERGVSQILELTSALRMTPRQIQEVFRIVGHTITQETGTERRLVPSLGYTVVLLSVLKVGKSEMYHRLGNGTYDNLEFGRFLISLLGKEDALWWFSLYITGAVPINDNQMKVIEELIKLLGFSSDGADAQMVDQLLKKTVRGWGRTMTAPIKSVYDKIETAASFSF